jgi:hypothetical protein
VNHGNTDGGGNFVGHAVHRVGAQDDEIGAAGFEPARGVFHLPRQRNPVAIVMEAPISPKSTDYIRLRAECTPPIRRRTSRLMMR